MRKQECEAAAGKGNAVCSATRVVTPCPDWSGLATAPGSVADADRPRDAGPGFGAPPAPASAQDSGTAADQGAHSFRCSIAL